MLTKMEVFSAQPGAPELTLGGFSPNLDPVQIRNIDGLGPVKAEISSSPFASSRGVLYQGSNVGFRNVVLTLGLNPDWQEQTMSSLRQMLYRYLLPQAWCKLRFFSDDMPAVDIEGYVESFEPNIFSDDPEIQVSVICPRPDFIEVDSTIYYGTVDDGTAELEFEYPGTQETGFEVRVETSAVRPAYTGSFKVRMQQEPEERQILTVNPITIDTLGYFKFSSVAGKKRVQRILLSDSTAINLLSRMSSDSVWPTIKPGTNIFSVVAAQPGQSWTLAFFNRYGGL